MTTACIPARTAHRCITCLALACLGWITTGQASARQHLDVRLSAPYPYDSARAAVVRVDVANDGDEDVFVLGWRTPFIQTGGRLPGSLFDVKDADGRAVRYTGRWVKFIGPALRDFLLMRPDDRRTAEVDLRPEYELGMGGTFTVRYVLPLKDGPDPDASDGPSVDFIPNDVTEAESNEVRLHLPGLGAAQASRAQPPGGRKGDSLPDGL